MPPGPPSSVVGTLTVLPAVSLPYLPLPPYDYAGDYTFRDNRRLVTYMRWKSSSALSSSETCLRVFLRRPSEKDAFGFLSLAWYFLLACEGSPGWLV